MTAASTPKGERRKQALIEAAAQLLAEGGFGALRHRAVAERADVPLAATTYYFDSLDELITAAVRYTAEQELNYSRSRLERITEGEHATEAVIELVLDAVLGPAPSSEGLERTLLRYEGLIATSRRPYLAPVTKDLGRQLHSLLSEIFARTGRPLKDDRVRQVLALVDGAVVGALIESNPDPRQAARVMLASALAGE
ncbi:TetR family transcriptional regulator [Pseudonocardiaceae bacterium YIM PH 21723]|nr:TetR family transcriptional regulator [Pseudonocardiaceae bacterium YIM PH 21723]